MSNQEYEIYQQLELVKDYASREGIPVEEAANLLQELGQDYCDPVDFLEDIGLEVDYIFDALQLIGGE